MRLYTCSGAPSPQRVALFLAEKGIALDFGLRVTRGAIAGHTAVRDWQQRLGARPAFAG